MDKTLYFPVFHGIKSEPVKVVCNFDGWAILEKAGFVKSERELPSEIVVSQPEPEKTDVTKGKGKQKEAE